MEFVMSVSGAGCGGICNRFNDGACMGACSMDRAGKESYVKTLLVREKAQANEPRTVTLKPINPAAYDMFKTPSPKVTKQNEIESPANVAEQIKVAPLKAEDRKEFFRMKL
jgi:hypothetical protein